MRRFGYGILAFAALAVGASAARAQTINTPLSHIGETDVAGNLTGGTIDSTKEGNFQTWAYIQSVLNFDITDSTLDCGIVTTGTNATQACSATGTNAANTTAQLVVSANADWGLTINNGTTYSNAAGDQNRSRLAVQGNPVGAFDLTLSAANAQNGNANPTSAAQPPNPAATVTISATYAQSQTVTQDPTKVDPVDNFGNYLGNFTVVLHEM